MRNAVTGAANKRRKLRMLGTCRSTSLARGSRRRRWRRALPQNPFAALAVQLQARLSQRVAQLILRAEITDLDAGKPGVHRDDVHARYVGHAGERRLDRRPLRERG